MNLATIIDETQMRVLKEIEVQCAIIKKFSIPNAQLIADRLYEYTSRGKFLRATVLRLSAKSFGYHNEETVIHVAAALELAQAALLIHDDVIDDDAMRRNRPAMHKLFTQDVINHKDSVMLGKSLAIAVGDVVLFHLFSQISYLPEIVYLFSQELTKTALGQAFEIYNSSFDHDISQEDIFTTMQYKTGCYTFLVPMSAGAILANSQQSLLTLIEKFSLLAGYIFQIRDDELNFLSEVQIGKTSGGDIVTNKKTLCRYELLSRCPQAQSLFESADYAQEIKALYITSGAQDSIQNQMECFKKELIQIIHQLNISAYCQSIWLELVDYLVVRKH